MVPGFKGNWEIVNANFDQKRMWIGFIVKNEESNFGMYHIALVEREGNYHASEVLHGLNVNDCPCQTKSQDPLWETCDYFTFYVYDLFEYMKEHPRLRLHLLFL